MLVGFQITSAYAQPVYITAEVTGQSNGTYSYLIKIDPVTCAFCPVFGFYFPWGDPGDIVLLPNGDLLVATGTILRYTPPNPNFVASYSAPQGGSVVDMILAPNGLVYVMQVNGLGTFDPSTNQFTYIGNWPSGITPGDVWFEGTTLYMHTFFYPQQIVQVDVGNPANSTIIGPLNGIPSIQGATSVGGSVFMVDYTDIYTYDTITHTATSICDVDSQTGHIGGMAYAPTGFPDLPCLCLTSAGMLQNQSPLLLCSNQTATVTSSTPPSYLPDDVIRYVLFTNPNDTSGSIVATSMNPSFSFNPATMQTGTLYYMARVVGNMLPSGEVDLTDPCLDFSNAAEVIWRPLPTVSFTVSNPNVCAGACTSLTATFTGTAPFSLTYTTPVSGTVTQTFSGNTGTFQVCTPAGAPPGSLVVQATRVVDLNCTCN